MMMKLIYKALVNNALITRFLGIKKHVSNFNSNMIGLLEGGCNDRNSTDAFNSNTPVVDSVINEK